jgi:hypothetical protein
MWIPPDGLALAMSNNVIHGSRGFEVICLELIFAGQPKSNQENTVDHFLEIDT